jgi:hypothetical protein
MCWGYDRQYLKYSLQEPDTENIPLNQSWHCDPLHLHNVSLYFSHLGAQGGGGGFMELLCCTYSTRGGHQQH